MDNAKTHWRWERERKRDQHGHPLLLPQYGLEGWTHHLPQSFDTQAVIDLYQDHATHERFHAEVQE